MDEHAHTIPELQSFAHAHKGWLFRGHCCPEWLLETTLERAAARCGVDEIEYERRIFSEFRRYAHNYGLQRVPPATDSLEWLALMQHHGAPTRLLDFTESFWIALFFAYEDAKDDCAVVALDRSSLAPNQPGKDYNAILTANIERGEHRDDFLRENVPFYTNERLAIQKGTFVFSLNLGKKFNDLLIQNNKLWVKLVIDKHLFPEIRRLLNDFNCNSRVLMPGIDGYAHYFKNFSI